MKILDITQKQPVTYCIPLWARDEQVRLAIARNLPNLEQGTERAQPLAIVGYGPSLTQTWEQVKGYDAIMSCSGAHKFLTERGIRPTHHVEVDPRPHKITLVGEPCPSTEYLVASTCCPAYFDHLLASGATVRLWHVFDNDAEVRRLLPPGAWAITGGCDVGLRCLTLAAVLGFRDLHVFGLDGNFGADGTKHAGGHPMAISAKHASQTEFQGVTYLTTPGMLEASRQTCHELDMLGASVTATFYGEGLTQALVRARVPKPIETPVIALSKPELISARYRDLNAELHRTNIAYGVGGERYAPIVLQLAEALKTRNILDYGAGKRRLGRAIPWQIAEYDPAIPAIAESPKPADLVVATDVLEHIEPDKLPYVLDDLRRCVKKVGYFVVHTGPSTKSLADGRNAHLIQQDRRWWELRLRKFFTVGKAWEQGPLVTFVVGPR
jgi:hypothetical protein